MSPIAPTNVLFIKLGERGVWESQCIQNGTLRLGYREVPHDLCMRGQWDQVHDVLRGIRNNPQAATSDRTQVQYFYEAPNSVLWVTFYAGRLYWCFSDPGTLVQNEDGTKTRCTTNRWNDRDIHGRPLTFDNLSGDILAVRGFRGTICKVSCSDYVAVSHSQLKVWTAVGA